MNYNNTMILSFADRGRKGKFVIEKDKVLGLFTNIEREYAKDTDIEKTYIRISFETAELIGLDVKHSYREQKYCDLHIGEELSVVLGLLKGSKGAEVLFGQK